MEKEYNIGLDIGTQSVGWAVVNANTNQVMKRGNKALWGVRLFDSSETAAARRNKRSIRRLYDRRRKRLKWLRDLFLEHINLVDPYFFTKMEESFYCKYDLVNKTIFFSQDDRVQIARYHQKFPTIYHLRKHLMESDKPEDIRLIYLALHHMIKYRGNFLHEGNNFDVKELDISFQWRKIFDLLVAMCPELELDSQLGDFLDYNKLEEAVLQDSNLDKKKYLSDELKSFDLKKEFISELGKAVCGNDFSAVRMFGLDLDSNLKVSFHGSSYEENYIELSSTLGNKIQILDAIKELYHMTFLCTLFSNGDTSISNLMVKRYDDHKSDLLFLKTFLRYNRDEYRKIFRSHKNGKKPYYCFYDQYVHNRIDYSDFQKAINRAIEYTLPFVVDQKLLDQYTLVYKDKIASGHFLPRLTEKDNGAFPYQLHMSEMKRIIEKQGKYFSFLLDSLDDGRNKICSLMEFRIPYYVGPLNNTTDSADVVNPNSWVIKRNNAPITPFNFGEVVDTDASAENFIVRMLSRCTYLFDEVVMPAQSILYSEYKVRNELKQIKVNGWKLPVEVQEKIYQKLFLKMDRCPTNVVLERYLRSLTEYQMMSELIITGYSASNQFANSMKSYVDFFGENGICVGSPYGIDDAEEIIRLITIFEDKKILERKIRKMYPEFSDDKVVQILSKQYRGWSRLSKKLLTTKYYKDFETGEFLSIMDLMRSTEKNFMQILNNNKYGFQKMINEYNQISDQVPFCYEVVNKLVTSPKNKRGIYQSILVLNEIVDYMGYDPKRIVIEMARENSSSKRTFSRKDYLNKLYDNCQKDIDNYGALKAQLDDCDNDLLQDDRLFLYFIQEGKSLYSMEPLRIDKLKEYEIDHIIPRCLLKDDSLDNKALVLKKENQKKAGSFVLPVEYRTNRQRNFWKRLQDHGLLSSKKMHNLCRTSYNDEDIEGFINRQLVETRQITKHVANIIKNYYKNTDVVYLKARLSSMYREKFELFKFRDLNDYHHAHDAYLAAVLGEYTKKYLKNVDFQFLRDLNRSLYDQGLYHELKYGYVINSIDSRFMLSDMGTGEVIFDVDQFNKTIAHTLYRNDILVSKKTEIRTGQFYDETKNRKGLSGVNLKDNLPSKWYGSYTSLKPSYAVVVRYKNKGKIKQKMMGIPIYYDVKSKKHPDLIHHYLCFVLKIDNFSDLEIVKDKIPFYSFINWDGQICRLVGASDKIEVCNALEFHIKRKDMEKWKYALNRLLNNKGKIDDVVYETQLEEIIEYILGQINKEYKLYQNLCETLNDRFQSDMLDELSLEEKEKIIRAMFRLLKCDSRTADLKFLEYGGKNMSGSFGRKNELTIEHAKIYYQSVTGLKDYYYEF